MAIYAPQFQSASLQFITETRSCALRLPAVSVPAGQSFGILEGSAGQPRVAPKSSVFFGGDSVVRWLPARDTVLDSSVASNGGPKEI
jgi:hypothetical protein